MGKGCRNVGIGLIHHHTDFQPKPQLRIEILLGRIVNLNRHFFKRYKSLIVENISCGFSLWYRGYTPWMAHLSRLGCRTSTGDHYAVVFPTDLRVIHVDEIGRVGILEERSVYTIATLVFINLL